MKTAFVDAPGTREGPCSGPCHHIRCQAIRAQAQNACAICEKPIGYGRAFFRNPDPHTLPRSLVHADCLASEMKASAQ